MKTETRTKEKITKEDYTVFIAQDDTYEEAAEKAIKYCLINYVK